MLYIAQEKCTFHLFFARRPNTFSPIKKQHFYNNKNNTKFSFQLDKVARRPTTLYP